MNTNDDQYDIIHRTWEDRKSHVKKGDHGDFIDLDSEMVTGAGLNFRDFDSPGNFRTFSSPTANSSLNYTVHAMGKGRYRINRNH